MKVAIIGFAKPSRDQAPYDDPSWEIWGVNDTWSITPRIDRVIDVHAPWIMEWEVRRRRGHLDFLRQFGGPVYLIEPRADIPTSVEYPLMDVIERILGRPYLTSSVAMAIGLALLDPLVDTIGLWGVELATASEYERQRPCVEWLLGLAQGRGVEVVLPEGCSLLSGPVYGRGDLNPGGERITPGQFTERLASLARREAELTAELDGLREKAQGLEGALAEARANLGRATDPASSLRGRQRVAQIEAGREPLLARMDEVQEALVSIRGMLSEARFWACQTPEGAAPEIVREMTRMRLSTVEGGLRIVEDVG